MEIWKVEKKEDGQTFDVYYKDTKQDINGNNVEIPVEIHTINIPDLDEEIANNLKRSEDFQNVAAKLQAEKDEILKHL